MEVSVSGNFSKLTDAGDLARRRVVPAAAANLKGSARSADPDENSKHEGGGRDEEG